jgi:starvation-inducible outer membrane lipoprotein
MGISRADIIDADIVDAQELAATGATSYRSDTVVSTVSATKIVTLTTTFGILYHDDPVEPGDKVVLTGTSGADGTYTVFSVLSANTFDVVETIANSTGGTAAFLYKAGAERIGVDSSGFVNSASSSLQGVLQDFDAAITTPSSGLGLTELEHESLTTQVHNVAQNSYVQVTRSGGAVVSVITYVDNTLTTKIREDLITRSGGLVTSVETKQYAGGLLSSTLTKTINRSGGSVVSIDVVLSVSISPTLAEADHEALDTLVHEIARTSYVQIVRSGGKVTAVVTWTDNTTSLKIRELAITRTADIITSTVTKQYKSTGAVAATLTETFGRDVHGAIDSITVVRS